MSYAARMRARSAGFRAVSGTVSGPAKALSMSGNMSESGAVICSASMVWRADRLSASSAWVTAVSDCKDLRNEAAHRRAEHVEAM